MTHQKYGGFQKYTIGKAQFCGKIPGNISFEQAATVPLCFYTAALGTYFANL
jgi:NADPH:quinone reductase-like Zn-dependent oxidoreductase